MKYDILSFMIFIKQLLNRLGMLDVIRVLISYSPLRLLRSVLGKTIHNRFYKSCQRLYLGNRNKLNQFDEDGVFFIDQALHLDESEVKVIQSEFLNIDSIISFDYETGTYKTGEDIGEYNYLNRKCIDRMNLASQFIKLPILKKLEMHMGSNLCLHHFTVTRVKPGAFIDKGSFIYHRDSQPNNRFKIIVYLTDSLNDESGPFEYLLGSHKTYNGLPQFGDSRYKDISRENVKTFYGKSGDGIVFLNNGIHRGGRTTINDRIVLTGLYTPSKMSMESHFEKYGYLSTGEEEWSLKINGC